jgi:hypothetical protein
MIDAPASAATTSQAAPAPTRDAKEIAKSGEFYLLVGVLVGVLFVGAIVLWLVDKWRRRNDCDTDNPSLSLSHFRGMFEAGEITQAEYDKILAKMAPKIKGTVPPASLPPPPPAGPPSVPKSE